MKKPKISFLWTDETALRERLQGVLRAHGTRSLRDLAFGHGSRAVLISERYGNWLQRTARDVPEEAREEDLGRSCAYLQAKVSRWLSGWRSLDWRDVLLLDVQAIDWVVDDGVEMQVGTVFAATTKVVVVCLIDEMEARGDVFEVDQRLCETERLHLCSRRGT